MTLNDSWRYQRGDDDWKSPKSVVRNVVSCAGQGGNYLLNIGPRADGSIPEESVKILPQVGHWMQRNGETIYGSELCRANTLNCADITPKGNTLYMHVYFWPGETVAIAGLKTRVKSARQFASKHAVNFEQDQFRVRFAGLPTDAPDQPVTTLEIECEGEPVQNTEFVRRERSRAGV
jgi:alpha-L-fucosidase